MESISKKFYRIIIYNSEKPLNCRYIFDNLDLAHAMAHRLAHISHCDLKYSIMELKLFDYETYKNSLPSF